MAIQNECEADFIESETPYLHSDSDLVFYMKITDAPRHIKW